MNSKLGIWALLIFPPLIFLSSLISCLVYYGANQLTEEQISVKITESIPFILFMSQLGMLVMLLVYSRKNQQNIFRQTFKSPQFIKDLIGGVLLGLAIAIGYFHLGIIDLIIYLQTYFGDYVPVGETSNNVGGMPLLFFVSNIILAPFVEENIYRNIAFKKLCKRYSDIATILITAFFFGVLHWLGGFWYIVATGLLIGIPFGLIQLKRQSILLVYTAHLTINFYEFIISIYP